MYECMNVSMYLCMYVNTTNIELIHVCTTCTVHRLCGDVYVNQGEVYLLVLYMYSICNITKISRSKQYM